MGPFRHFQDLYEVWAPLGALHLSESFSPFQLGGRDLRNHLIQLYHIVIDNMGRWRLREGKGYAQGHLVS